MIEISVKEFINFPNKEKYVFFFSIPGLCRLCSIQEKEYEKFNIPNLIKVSGTITDEDYLMNELNIEALPCTSVFNKEGSFKIKKYGIQYETQINQLLKEF